MYTQIRNVRLGQKVRGRLSEWRQQLRFMGVGGILRALHFSLLSEWGWLRTPFVRPKGHFTPLGAEQRIERIESGACLYFAGTSVEIKFLGPDLVRLSWQPGTPPIPYAMAQQEWPDVEVGVWIDAEGWHVASPSMRVTLYREDRCLRFFDQDGRLLRSEGLPERRNGEWRHRVNLRPEEHLYGLGEQTGSLNRRGSSHWLWNTDPMRSYGPKQSPLYFNIPVHLSLHDEGSYLIFYENSYPAAFHFDEDADIRFEGGMLRYYITPGPPEHAYERYTELTGRPPLPPRWALGYHQSRFSYDTEAEVSALAEGFRRHDLPLSAIHLDIHYMDGYRVFTVDQERFPDLARLAQALEEQGIRLVVILDPGVKREMSFPLYREGLQRRLFCLTHRGYLAIGPVWPGWCAFPDFSDPHVRAWWGKQYRTLLDAGIAGFWHDMNEPAITGAWGQRTLAHSVLHALEGRGGTHEEAHNLYGLLMAKAGYEALRREEPGRRPFLLTRSGWAGSQRFAWTWTGDTQSSWAMLRQTVSTVLGLSLSGMPYSGPDIGGFKGELSDELYVRWFQLATFLPFCRTHTSLGMGRREPWCFGEDALVILRRLLYLRYRLLPYLYTLAWHAHQTGHPLVRPLFWTDGRERTLWDVEDAFLLGDALLVAPVLEHGATRRTLTLPAGQWYDFWDDSRIGGSGDIQLSAPLEHIPLLVRAGAVLPLEEEGRLVLHLYAPDQGETGSGILYSDAGDGYGEWRLDRFQLEWNGDNLELSWESEGEYPLAAAVELHAHGVAFEQVFADGTPLDHDGPRLQIHSGAQEHSRHPSRVTFSRCTILSSTGARQQVSAR